MRSSHAASPEGFDRGDVVGEARGELHGEVGVAEIRIGPRLRDALPAVAVVDELAGHRVVAQDLAPARLAAQQLLDDALVLGRVAVLAVEPDLDGEGGRTR